MLAAVAHSVQTLHQTTAAVLLSDPHPPASHQLCSCFVSAASQPSVSVCVFFFFYFRVFDLCCCFLLWAEFYTACQSPERHTLEGPVEWDTKSDASWEHSSLSPYTYPSYPLPHCLSSSSSLFLLLQTHLFPLMRILFSSPPLILLLSFSPSDASATPKTPGQLWMTPLPLCSGRLHATSVGAFSAGALGWSQPTAPSMHRSECVANEHHWRNVPTSVLFPPCLD